MVWKPAGRRPITITLDGVTGKVYVSRSLLANIMKDHRYERMLYVYYSKLEGDDIIAINNKQLMEMNAECSTIGIDPETNKHAFYLPEETAHWLQLVYSKDQDYNKELTLNLKREKVGDFEIYRITNKKTWSK